MPMDPSTRGLYANAMRWHHARLPYMRRYPANSVWKGYLSGVAISELELFGNTVERCGGYYKLNSTAPAQEPVRATLIDIVQPPQGVL